MPVEESVAFAVGCDEHDEDHCEGDGGIVDVEFGIEGRGKEGGPSAIGCGAEDPECGGEGEDDEDAFFFGSPGTGVGKDKGFFGLDVAGKPEPGDGKKDDDDGEADEHPLGE